MPQLNVADVAAFSYEARGGYADASQLALHFGAVARSAGAKVRQNTPVARGADVRGRTTAWNW